MNKTELLTLAEENVKPKPVPPEGGVLVLDEAGFYQLWRSCRTDCDHASGTGREPALDFRVPFSPRTQFLYGAARSGSSATCHLHWLADAQDLGRSDSGFVIYPSLTFYSYRVVVDLYRPGETLPLLPVSFTALNPPWRQSCCRRRIASAPVR